MTRYLFLACAALLVAGHAGAEDVPDRLERDRLLFYQDADGEVRPVRTVADWQVRRAAILRAMQDVMGPLPGKAKRGRLRPKVEREDDCGTYVRRVVSYRAEPGGRVAAYLLVPKAVLRGGGRAPAVLCLHPTSAQGKKVTVGLADAPNRAYAHELAERGFVCLAPPYPLLADYAPDLKRLGYKSGTMKAIWDNVRGLDLLDELPFVRRGGYGAVGHSLGGHNSVYTAAFDDRIAATVSSCGLDSYWDYMGGNIRGWTSDRYMPRLLDYKDRLADVPFDFPEVLAAIAPRRVLVLAPTGDRNFRWASAARCVRAAADVFALYGVPGRLRVEHPACGHDFPPVARARAYRFLEEALR